MATKIRQVVKLMIYSAKKHRLIIFLFWLDHPTAYKNEQLQKVDALLLNHC